MITERLQKSREFIEGECVKAASAQNLCRELKHVRIRRLFPKGNAANWEPTEFEPPLLSANVWRKRRLARSLTAMLWLNEE